MSISIPNLSLVVLIGPSGSGKNTLAGKPRIHFHGTPLAFEPLRRVHVCAFGVLALESEPVDPRL
jgi:ribose 1,5-bisphosphokinase PhnN